MNRLSSLIFSYSRNTIHQKFSVLWKTISRNKSIMPRRAVLYVPAHDKRKVDKISTLKVDCVVLDLEDGVAFNKKNDARNFIAQLPISFDFGLSEYAVRINSIDSDLAEIDLSAVFESKRLPSAIFIPKVYSAEHVKWIYNQLALVKENVISDINLFFYVESARSLLNLQEICKTAQELGTPKFSLAGVVFGSDDFCADIGATRTSYCQELLTTRQMLIIIAKAFKLQVIDMVHIDYTDLNALQSHSRESAAMGFTGKQVIHPSQIEIVQNCYSPSEEKIKWATELITLYHDHQDKGIGAFTFRGSMVDRPLLLQAENILEIANGLKLKK